MCVVWVANHESIVSVHYITETPPLILAVFMCHAYLFLLPNTSPPHTHSTMPTLKCGYPSLQPPQQSQPPPPPLPPARERDVLDLPTAQTGPGGVQIRKDYNPKQAQVAPHQQMQTNPSYLISPITGEKIPVDKLQDHMKYGELACWLGQGCGVWGGVRKVLCDIGTG